MDSFSERSEKPTSKRLKKAKEEGEFAYSPKFAVAIALVSSLILLFFFSLRLLPLLCKEFTTIFSLMGQQDKTSLFELPTLFIPIVKQMAFLILFILIAAFIAHCWQSGFIFSFKLKKKGKQNKHRFYALFYILFCWGIVAFTLYYFLSSYHASSFIGTFDQQITFLKEKLFLFVCIIGFIFLGLGGMDYLVQRYFFYKEMHMTREEVKEELKDENVAKGKK